MANIPDPGRIFRDGPPQTFASIALPLLLAESRGFFRERSIGDKRHWAKKNVDTVPSDLY
jgi:hypothetical protein